MKRITLEIPDRYDDVLSITCIGSKGSCTNINVNATEIRYHNGDTYVIRVAPGTTSELVKGENKEDVQPVIHAEWKELDYGGFYECSKCGYMTDYKPTKYCAECGARMDKE